MTTKIETTAADVIALAESFAGYLNALDTRDDSQIDEWCAALAFYQFRVGVELQPPSMLRAMHQMCQHRLSRGAVQ